MGSTEATTVLIMTDQLGDKAATASLRATFSGESTSTTTECTMVHRSAGENWDVVRSQVLPSVKFSMCFKTLRDMTDERCIDTKRLQSIKTIGVGAFASIEKANLVTNDGQKMLVAVKKLKIDVMDDELDREQLIQEISLLRKLRHGNIVEYLGVGLEKGPEGHMLLVEEFMAGGTLKQLVIKQMHHSGRVLYSYSDALRWFLQIAKGLKYLHSAKPMVIHRDLKLENILLTGGTPDCMHAKICDFGLSVLVDRARGPLKHHYLSLSASMSSKESKKLEEGWKKRGRSFYRTRNFSLGSVGSRGKSYDMSGQTGSLMYMAPEVFKFQPYNEKADVFSFAVMLYEVFYRYLTVSAFSVEGTLQERERYAARVADGYRPILDNKEVPADVNQLIFICWAQKPEDRQDMGWVVERLKEIEASGLLEQADRAKHAKACQSCFPCCR